VGFIERFLTHIKGEWFGQYVVLEKWEREIIRSLFGWKRVVDGLRRYRTVFLALPRKNGKSFLGACIALYLLLSDNEPGAEIYSAAADRDQAALIFDVAKQMVENEPALAKRCEVYRRSIVARQTASVYRVLSSDAKTKHGMNPHGVIFDELHTQPNRDLLDTLETGTGARRQPVVFIATTAGYDKHSVCWEKWDYAQKVAAGIVRDDSFLPIIYAADTEDDWTSLRIWKKANPNLGISVKLRYIQGQCEKAKEQPANENTFRRLHLNQWTEQATRWMPMDKWDLCGLIEFTEDDLLGDECCGGLDLASVSDIAAFSMLFPPTDERPVWANLWRFYVPEETAVKRSKRDQVKYTEWIRTGHILATPGNVTDYDFIRADIGKQNERFNVREIAFDRWNATQLTTQLAGDGFTMTKFGQGFQSMSAPTKELMKLVLGKLYAHSRNPVARWMAANAAVKQDPAGGQKLDKEKSMDKIDGLVATAMALGIAMVKPEGGSIYDNEGIEAF
jgi:phage terminase large subunit-like protein